jgi:hypothetical protein
MKYTIEFVEVGKTTTGKTKATLTLKDEKGEVHDHVTAWGDFPKFEELMMGRTVEGNIATKVNGQYTNKTLYPPRTEQSAPIRRQPSGIVKAMEKKEASIAKFQDSKQERIERSAAIRDATILTQALVSKLDTVSFEEMEEIWKKWHKFIKDEFIGEPF